MKKLKQYIKESLLDDEEDFIDPIENHIKQDIEIIKDSLTVSNYRLILDKKDLKLWEPKKFFMLKLSSGFLFKLANFKDLPNEDDYNDYRIRICFTNTSIESYIVLGVEYVNKIGKSVQLKKIIYLDNKKYQTVHEFIKYLNNVLFKDKQSIVNLLKDIKETGKSVPFF